MLNISRRAQRDISRLKLDYRSEIVEALDLMQSIGRIGEPLLREKNIWILKGKQVRFIYRVISDKNILLQRVLSWEETL